VCVCVVRVCVCVLSNVFAFLSAPVKHEDKLITKPGLAERKLVNGDVSPSVQLFKKAVNTECWKGVIFLGGFSLPINEWQFY